MVSPANGNNRVEETSFPEEYELFKFMIPYQDGLRIVYMYYFQPSWYGGVICGKGSLE